MPTHILFVPWENAKGKKEESKAWAEHGNTKKLPPEKAPQEYAVVIYRENRKNNNFQNFLTGKIYILGHGAAAYGSIGDIDTSVPGNEKKVVTELKASVVCDRLIKSGLSTAFNGKIMCYNCESAKSTKQSDGFAQQVADDMLRRGYEHCQVFGYNMSVSLEYENSLGEGLHRHALAFQECYGKYMPIKRAKDAKQLVKPNPEWKTNTNPLYKPAGRSGSGLA